MSELAFNINGEGFEVPAHATGWRVRKMRHKGAPEVVYGRDGLPLVLPISAQMDELRAEVDTTGRYRLDLVDQDNKAIAGAPSGYVQVNFESAPASSQGPGAIGPLVSAASFGKQSENILLESMRMQSLVAVAVVERFPQMMEAAATLLRAADGAGLPARPPMATSDDDDDEEDDGEAEAVEQDTAKTTASFLDLLQPAVGPAMQYLVSGFMSGQLKLPGGLAEMFDWRKAAARGKSTKTESHPAQPASATTPATAAPAPEVTVETPAAAEPPPKSGIQNAAQFVAIQEALGPEDAAFVRQAASNLSREQVEAWLARLGQLSVADAVAEIRKEIAKSKAAGGPS
ncbi:MAG TPA: hypothetical protein VMJ10_34105 [Kofleriaceae bacterium]|nr:hypothetical protein [Kofleriaceae bacterium]